MKEQLRKNLVALRKAHKLTQEQVAAKIFVTRSNYAAYEEGRAQPPLMVIDTLCDMYNITFKQLIGSEALPDGVEFETRYSTAPDNVRKAIDLLLN